MAWCAATGGGVAVSGCGGGLGFCGVGTKCPRACWRNYRVGTNDEPTRQNWSAFTGIVEFLQRRWPLVRSRFQPFPPCRRDCRRIGAGLCGSDRLFPSPCTEGLKCPDIGFKVRLSACSDLPLYISPTTGPLTGKYSGHTVVSFVIQLANRGIS